MTSHFTARIRGRGQRGMVTLELAIGILSAAIVLFCCSAALALLILQDQLEVVATQSARHAARGDTEQVEDVKRKAPRGARVDVTKADGWATSTASAQRRWGQLGPFTVTATASAPLEPGE